MRQLQIMKKCGGESNIHLFLKQSIAKSLEKIGFSTQIEKTTNQGRIDIYAIKDGKELKIEIMKSHAPEWILLKVNGDINYRKPKPKIFRINLECLQCGWKWFPRSEENPMLCPNVRCHSPRWNQAKEKTK